MKRGTIVSVSDSGSIVSLVLRVRRNKLFGGGMATVEVHGDGNMTRRALHDLFGEKPEGKRCIFVAESWGGLSWIGVPQ